MSSSSPSSSPSPPFEVGARAVGGRRRLVVLERLLGRVAVVVVWVAVHLAEPFLDVGLGDADAERPPLLASLALHPGGLDGRRRPALIHLLLTPPPLGVAAAAARRVHPHRLARLGQRGGGGGGAALDRSPFIEVRLGDGAPLVRCHLHWQPLEESSGLVDAVGAPPLARRLHAAVAGRRDHRVARAEGGEATSVLEGGGGGVAPAEVRDGGRPRRWHKVEGGHH